MSILPQTSRRSFLASLIPACSMCCLGGCARLAGGSKHKYQKQWELSYEEVFQLRFGYYIDLMKRFEEYLGREELVDMIKRATDESTMADAAIGTGFDFRKWLQGGREYFANMMSFEVVEWTDTTYAMRVSECLWHEVFKQADATHIGYATVCHGDFASARATHPDLRLERSKTIMQGDSYCDHRWVFEA